MSSELECGTEVTQLRVTGLPEACGRRTEDVVQLKPKEQKPSVDFVLSEKTIAEYYNKYSHA